MPNTLRTVALFAVSITLMAVIRPAPAHAQQIKPVLLVPANRGLDASKIGQYKSDILWSLKEIQQWYNDRLKGKTFKINDDLEIVRSERELRPNRTAGESFSQLDGFGLLPEHDGLIYAVWIIGSAEPIRTAFHPNPRTGWAVQTHEDLLNLSKQADLVKRRESLGVTSHELGHTFGLVYAGYAKAHPCSQSSQDECVSSAPEPLPLAEEYDNSVMGSWWEWPYSGLGNSTYNPEIWKICQSPFINPPGNCPAPHPPVKAFRFDTISHAYSRRIGAGEILEISGSGFGNTRGDIEFHNPRLSPQYMTHFEILEWTDTSVKVLIKKEAERESYTTWDLVLVTKIGTPPRRQPLGVRLTIKHRPFSSITITADFHVTCGEERKGVPQLKADIISVTREHGKLLGRAFTDENGYSSISITIADPKPGERFELIPDQIINLPPFQPGTASFTISNPPASTKYVTRFHYPLCLEEIITPTPTPTKVPFVPPNLQSGQQINTCKDLYYIDARDEEDLDDDICIHQHTPRATYPECEPYAYDVLEMGYCTGELEPTPSPAGTGEEQVAIGGTESAAPTPTPEDQTETGSQVAPAVISLLVSNYDDFRDTNYPGDEKASETTEFSSPSEGKTHIDWKLSTIIEEKKLYIRKFLSDDTYEDVEIAIDSGQTAEVEFLEITAKVPRVVTRIMINGEETDLNDPIKLIRLPGTEGQAGEFTIPVLVEYSDGATESEDLLIVYNPETRTGVDGSDSDGTGTTVTPGTSTQENGAGQTVTTPNTSPAAQVTPEATPTEDDTPQICDNKYYWDDDANDGGGACIETYATPPECVANNFEQVENWLCGR